MANNTTTTDFGAALSAAIAGGYVAQLNGGTYTVSQPIVIQINSTIQGPLGINGNGATLVSQITNGAPVIEIDVGPGVDLRYLDLSNFNIQGNGQEGDGIKIVADGNDRWDYNWNIANVNVSHVGGYGLDMQGSIFEGLVSNSEMDSNGLGGAYIANSAGGGVASALRWLGGGFQGNNGPGLTLGDGARDLTIDGATVANNSGPGISAMSGITSVTDSTFQDNQGDGVAFQNYGNFNHDTFITSGSQTVGLNGYLGSTGNATLIDNSSTDTGSDSTALASLQGDGHALDLGNTGAIDSAANVATDGAGGGNHAAVSVSTQGVALPRLQPITASAAAAPGTTDTSALGSAIQSAFSSGTVAHLTSGTSYTVTAPIVIDITSSTDGPVGIDLGGAKIESDITDGSPVIEIVVAPGVHVGSLDLSNFSIFGNGSEGDGIKVVADGADRSAELNLSNVDVEHVGGIGLDVLGNVQGTVTDTWMNGNAEGGARFADGPDGGVASNLQWVGGGFRLNGVAGMILDNGTHDMSVSGAYFVENQGPGIDATSGITSVLGSGFENNSGSGAVVQGAASFTDDTFSTYGPQTTAVGGYLSGGQVTLTGSEPEYYGSGSDPTVLANMQGQGTLAIAGGGNVIAGPNIAVTGADPIVDPPTLNAASESAPSQSALTALAVSGGSSADSASVAPVTSDDLATAGGSSADSVPLTPGTSTDLVTSDGTWSFGAATTVEGGHEILLNGQLAANGYADELVIAKGHLFAESSNSDWWEWTETGWQQTSDPSGAGLSADGTSLTAGASGDLVTSAGTWSFGSATTVEGGHQILLDGRPAASGYANELVVDGNGHLFANSANGDWWEWTGAGWNLSAAGASPAAEPGAGNLVTSDGTWSFGSATTVEGGHQILLNGQSAASGYANELAVDTNGHLFADSANAGWWEWTGTGWQQIASPNGIEGGTLATDSASLTAGTNANIVTSDGSWSLGSATTVEGGHQILLNGQSAAYGYANELAVDANGHLFANSANGDWWEWTGKGWTEVAPDPAGGTDPSTVHLDTANGVVTLDHVAPGASAQSHLMWS